jgi:DNA repair ATPase RecN
MTLKEYVWIYGLAEALLLSVLLNIFLVVQWWRRRRAAKRLERAHETVGDLIREEISAATNDPEYQPDLRNYKLEYLNALLVPFQKKRTDDISNWIHLLRTLHESFSKLTKRGAKLEGEQPFAANGEEPAEFSGEPMSATAHFDSEIDALLAQHQLSLAALTSDRSATSELKRKCEDIRRVNNNLKVQLESIAKTDSSGQIQQLLDQIEESNFELQQMVFAIDRNHGHLGPQLEAMGQQIHTLQLTIKNYRKAMQKLITERDDLVEEKKSLLKQIDARTKLCERLTHNFDALRREYTKLYEATR